MKFNASTRESSGGAKNYLKLKSGENAVGVFCGDIVEYYQVWEQGSRPQIVSEGSPGAKFRFRINFVTKENGVLTAKVFEGGWPSYKILKDMHEEYNLEKVFVKISRDGSGLQTKYSFLVSMNTKVTPAIEKQLKEVELQDLSVGEKKETASASAFDDGPSPFDSDDEIPF